ncbi:hypothetical protein RQP46_005400 [Phenoliferia psychrophenolica]
MARSCTPLRAALAAVALLVAPRVLAQSGSNSASVSRPSIAFPLTVLGNTTASSTSLFVPQATASSVTNATAAPVVANATALVPAPPPQLYTHVDATFGVLGSILVITGVPLGFWGGKNRWSSFFLVGLYIGAMIVSLLILRFGVEPSVNDPTSATRGLFLFASLAGGLIMGAASVFWWKAAQHVAPAFAGFAFGLFIQSVRSDGLIRPVGLRYILFIVPAAAGFSLSTFKSLNIMCTLISTAILGSMALVLGVDCFTTSGLKEFFVYNLGLQALWPKLNGHYTLALGIEVELGVIGALALSMGFWQYRGYDLLLSKTRELKAADKERRVVDEEAGKRMSKMTTAELGDWEEKYGSGARSPSSVAALLGPGPPSSLDLGRSRTRSGLSERERTYSGDFLPRINFDRADGTAAGASSSRPRPPSRSLSQGPDWEAYLTSRKILTPPAGSTPLPSRRASMVLLDTIASEDGHDRSRDEDELPLALLRSPTSPIIRTIPPSPARQGAISFPSSERRPLSAAFPSSPSLSRSPPPGGHARRQSMLELSEATPRSPPAKVMALSELEDKHRRRISQLQAPVQQKFQTDAEVATAKAAYEARRQREGAEMRAHEAQRRERTTSGASATRRSSMGSLSGLLGQFGAAGAGGSRPTSPAVDSGSPGGTFGPGSRSPSLSQKLPPSAAAPGHGLDEPRRRPPLAVRRESQRLSGLSKVAAWQEESALPGPSSSGSGSQSPPQSVAPTGPKKKHDWLGY